MLVSMLKSMLMLVLVPLLMPMLTPMSRVCTLLRTGRRVRPWRSRGVGFRRYPALWYPRHNHW